MNNFASHTKTPTKKGGNYMLNKYATNMKELWPEIESGDATMLSNGEMLIRKYGKYNPGICIVLPPDSPVLPVMVDGSVFMNIKFDCSIIETIEGEFWISKKGTPCFRPKVLGPDILIETSWGGCFESSRGSEFEEISKLNGCKYAKFAPSHGGGEGYCYYVFPRTYQKTIDLDEI